MVGVKTTNMWQDYVISAISLSFTFFLIPQAYYVYTGRIPISKFTAASTAIGLLIMAVTYISMNLTYAATTTCITAILWAVMLFHRKHNLPSKK
jgi:hypothetical protein